MFLCKFPTLTLHENRFRSPLLTLPKAKKDDGLDGAEL